MIEFEDKERFHFLGMFASDRRYYNEDFVIRYVFLDKKEHNLKINTINTNNEFKSIQNPLANLYEREIYEMFGLSPVGLDDLRPLRLFPENYPKDFHPLRKDTKLDIEYRGYGDYEFENFEPEGSFKILVGPIHAGIIEPGHFRFTLLGEPILKLEIRHSWKHKGIEKFAEEKSVNFAKILSENISGDHTIAHTLAFVRAVENACNINISLKAKYIRAIFLELERLMCNLNDFAFIFQDVGYSFGAQKVFVLKEKLMRLNYDISGHRFNKGVITLGGVSKDLSLEDIKRIKEFLGFLEKEYFKYKSLFLNSPTILERTDTTGEINYETAMRYYALGYTAKASGVFADTRVLLDEDVCKNMLSYHVLQKGDVTTRVLARFNDIEESIKVIKTLLDNIEEGEIIKSQKLVPNSMGFGVVESQRGNIVHMVELDQDANIYRWKIRDPSFHNWPLIQFAVLKDIIADFPLVNKSLNLSYAGNDL